MFPVFKLVYNNWGWGTLVAREGVINISFENDPFHDSGDVFLTSQMAFSEVWWPFWWKNHEKLWWWKVVCKLANDDDDDGV